MLLEALAIVLFFKIDLTGAFERLALFSGDCSLDEVLFVFVLIVVLEERSSKDFLRIALRNNLGEEGTELLSWSALMVEVGSRCCSFPSHENSSLPVMVHTLGSESMEEDELQGEREVRERFWWLDVLRMPLNATLLVEVVARKLTEDVTDVVVAVEDVATVTEAGNKMLSKVGTVAAATTLVLLTDLSLVLRIPFTNSPLPI